MGVTYIGTLFLLKTRRTTGGICSFNPFRQNEAEIRGMKRWLFGNRSHIYTNQWNIACSLCPLQKKNTAVRSPPPPPHPPVCWPMMFGGQNLSSATGEGTVCFTNAPASEWEETCDTRWKIKNTRVLYFPSQMLKKIQLVLYTRWLQILSAGWYTHRISSYTRTSRWNQMMMI